LNQLKVLIHFIDKKESRKMKEIYLLDQNKF